MEYRGDAYETLLEPIGRVHALPVDNHCAKIVLVTQSQERES